MTDKNKILVSVSLGVAMSAIVLAHPPKLRSPKDSDKQSRMTRLSLAFQIPEIPNVVPLSSSNKLVNVTLEWNAVDVASNYIIYQGVDLRSYTNIQIVRGQTNGSISFSKMRNPYVDTIYHFAVTSVDNDGNESGFSDECLLTYLAAKTNVVVNVYSNNIKIWTATNPIGYMYWTGYNMSITKQLQ